MLLLQVEKFFSQCDPERDNLCLYGLPDGTWAVDLPAEEVPPEIPEPALGINFARDGMQVGSEGGRQGGHTCMGLLSSCTATTARMMSLSAALMIAGGQATPPLCLCLPPTVLGVQYIYVEGSVPNTSSIPRLCVCISVCLQRKDWLALVAVHSDSWLLSLAFYKGARLNREQR